MSSFEIRGGNKLKGELIPQGAKNEALQIVSAVLLTPEKVTISNIPNIRDVMKLIELLGAMGVEVNQIAKDTFTFEAKNVNLEYLLTDDLRKRVEHFVVRS
jgi:UDP-N-acetylglucosamine 1-carboxyvinyltransferase